MSSKTLNDLIGGTIVGLPGWEPETPITITESAVHDDESDIQPPSIDNPSANTPEVTSSFIEDVKSINTPENLVDSNNMLNVLDYSTSGMLTHSELPMDDNTLEGANTRRTLNYLDFKDNTKLEDGEVDPEYHKGLESPVPNISSFSDFKKYTDINFKSLGVDDPRVVNALADGIELIQQKLYQAYQKLPIAGMVSYGRELKDWVDKLIDSPVDTLRNFNLTLPPGVADLLDNSNEKEYKKRMKVYKSKPESLVESLPGSTNEITDQLDALVKSKPTKPKLQEYVNIDDYSSGFEEEFDIDRQLAEKQNQAIAQSNYERTVKYESELDAWNTKVDTFKGDVHKLRNSEKYSSNFPNKEYAKGKLNMTSNFLNYDESISMSLTTKPDSGKYIKDLTVFSNFPYKNTFDEESWSDCASAHDIFDVQNNLMQDGLLSGHHEFAGFEMGTNHIWRIRLKPYRPSEESNKALRDRRGYPPPLPYYKIYNPFHREVQWVDFGLHCPVLTYSFNMGSIRTDSFRLFNSASHEVFAGVNYNMILTLSILDDADCSMAKYMLKYLRYGYNPTAGTLRPYYELLFEIELLIMRSGGLLNHHYRLIGIPIDYTPTLEGSTEANENRIDIVMSIVGMIPYDRNLDNGTTLDREASSNTTEEYITWGQIQCPLIDDFETVDPNTYLNAE